MILPGHSLIARKIINNTISTALQTQPCGVDLTLKRVFTWTSAGTIDFDNSFRQTASTKEIPFVPIPESSSSVSVSPDTDTDTNTVPISEHNRNGIADLPQGSYLVEFNETVSIPLDAMGQIMVRSSLFRSGAIMSGGVIDAGYKGALGALLQVVNPAGLRVYKDARIAQTVFQQMTEPVEGYKGAYQGRTTMG